MDRHLRTHRLILRPPVAGDEVAAYERWSADPRVLRYLGWRPHTGVEQTRHLLGWEQARWLKRSAWTWMLVCRDPARGLDPQLPAGPIGMIQLLPQRFDGPAQHLRLGFLLSVVAQRRGLMGEAVQTVVDHAFAQPATWRVDALCDVDNESSRRLLERQGFRCEGRLARHTLHPNVSDDPRDVWCFARVREAAPD